MIEPEAVAEEGDSESAAASGARNGDAATDDYVRNDTEETFAVQELLTRTARESVEMPRGAPVPDPDLASDRLQNYQAEEASKDDSQTKCGEAKSLLEIVRDNFRLQGLDCGSLSLPLSLPVCRPFATSSQTTTLLTNLFCPLSLL